MGNILWKQTECLNFSLKKSAVESVRQSNMTGPSLVHVLREGQVR